MCTFVEPIRDRTGHVVGVLFADVPMEDVSILSMDMDGLIERGGRISVMVMLVFLGLFCVILWLSIRASQRYRKDTYDSEIQKLKSEIEHLKTINRKLMQRNLDLSKKESASHFLG
jgi:Ca2+/Na+ antiporter